jgi:cell division GTPase FtsZ
MKKSMNTVKGDMKFTPPSPPPMQKSNRDELEKKAPSANPPALRNLAAGLSPRSRRRIEKDVVINDEFDYDVGMRMAFLGAGQGGGRIADAFYRLGYRRAAAFNTTESDFEHLSEKMNKHSLETGGSSKDISLASQSLAGREEEVRDLLIKSWGSELDCALICVSLGGGTGSGTAGQLVKIAREYMKDMVGQQRVGAIVSLPTTTEGYTVNRNAVSGFQELVDLGVSPLLIIDNAKVNQMYKPAMSKLHATANETVSSLFHLFNQLSAVRAEITFDRSEFAQLLDSGILVMGAADIQKIDSPNDISSAIREDLANNVLAQVDLRTGKKGACLFVASQDILDELPSDYFDAGFSQLDRLLGSVGNDQQTVVHRGLYVGSEPGLQCYTMIGELDLPKEKLIEMATKGGLTNGSGGSATAAWLGVDD